MEAKEFKEFRLVGGTSLSLQIGHRMSIDIDMFTDALYGSIDFDSIDKYFKANYVYVSDEMYNAPIANGKSYLVGNSVEDSVKVDVFYTSDPFIQQPLIVDGIRLATIDEIIAMKMDVVSRKGRKKDFWDLHEFIDDYSIDRMIELHKEQNEYTHNEIELRKNFINFSKADVDLDPVCLKGKDWEAVKFDLIGFSTS